jgi:hypothetical protein
MNHDEILALRADGWQPKNIAKKLGLRLAAVETVLRDAATLAQAEREARGELPELLECLTDRIGFRYLIENQQGGDDFDDFESQLLGLSHVLVTRLDRGKRLSVNFMVDYWCLGAKSALPSRRVDLMEHNFLKNTLFGPYGGAQPITLEQAQSIVYGAIEYARKLGFEPHPDAIEALKVLGPRPETLLPLEFGKNGRVTFINGPDDDVYKIQKILKATVGEGNYDFFAQKMLFEDDDEYEDDENFFPF